MKHSLSYREKKIGFVYNYVTIIATNFTNNSLKN